LTAKALRIQGIPGLRSNANKKEPVQSRATARSSRIVGHQPRSEPPLLLDLLFKDHDRAAINGWHLCETHFESITFSSPEFLAARVRFW